MRKEIAGKPVHQPNIQQRHAQLNDQGFGAAHAEYQVDEGEKVGVERPHPVGFVPAPVTRDQAHGPVMVGFAVQQGDGGQVGAAQLEEKKHAHGCGKKQQRQKQVVAGARFHDRSIAVSQ